MKEIITKSGEIKKVRKISKTHKDNKRFNSAMARTGTNPVWTTRKGWVFENFNCGLCSWRGTPTCPHGIERGKVHPNRICSTRVKWVKELWSAGANTTKVLQVDELLKLRMVGDNLLADYSRTGELNPEFVRISKNLINLTDKMRKQDEGIKINAEINVGVDEFRSIVEEQARLIKPKNVINITKKVIK